MESLKLYQGIVWKDASDSVGQRVTLWATDPIEAGDKLKAEYGEKIIFTLHNEEDAARPR